MIEFKPKHVWLAAQALACLGPCGLNSLHLSNNDNPNSEGDE